MLKFWSDKSFRFLNTEKLLQPASDRVIKWVSKSVKANEVHRGASTASTG